MKKDWCYRPIPKGEPIRFLDEDEDPDGERGTSPCDTQEWVPPEDE